MDDANLVCGLPTPSVSDVLAWNMLDGDTSNESEVRVGLFSYDISCLASMCAQPSAAVEAYYCDFIAARGLDGLAFGIQFKINIDSVENYCAGFHRAETFDHFVCHDETPDITNYYFPQNYTVTSDIVTDDAITSFETTAWGCYGFSEFLFSFSEY